ncbi:uncharacterized protein LOC123545448 [Mercenaria mercenaria]|uniref:uncharacterized protein LOC123545448 n=1 Tax=Mercenaria mercenaria TaxID=6596 RepID=UPI00234FAFF5|nr:uncharacterized protein LOC123545448 [Mercenaria mercenaria]
MEMFKVISAIFIADVYLTGAQQLYSSFLHVTPTSIKDQIQLHYHFSWKEQGLAAGTCVTPVCLKVYKLTNKTAQFFGRFTGFQWWCYRGCASKNVISDLSSLMFTEVTSFGGLKWEAGEETVIHTFNAADADDITIRFQFSNGTHSEVVEDAHLNLGIRSDTKRPNMSPSTAVLPIYRVPLGCSVEIDLFPYDGDGDYTTCRWNNILPSASLDNTSCKIAVHATSSTGYRAGQQYKGSVYLEDYSSVPVNISRNGNSSVTSGPFSSAPVIFTVYVSNALSAPSNCLSKPRFEPNHASATRSYLPLTNYSTKLTTTEKNVTILTVGHQGTVFHNTATSSGTEVTSDWTITGNDTGVYKTCFMVYNSNGVPGDTICDTLLTGDTDDCARNDTCTDKSCRHCKDYWQYYTCSYDTCNDQKLNLGLIVGAAVGSVILLAAIVTGICLYLRYIKKKKTKVTDLSEKHKEIK